VKLIKKLLLAVVASGVTLLLAFIVAEIYLRKKEAATVDPYIAELYTHDGRKVSLPLGQVKLALMPFTVYQNFPSQHTATFNINSRGLRDGEDVEKDLRPKVIFLGGSATFGYGAKTDADTIPAIVQQSIESHHIINGGVIGFLSGQELTYLVTDLIDYKPAVVVAYDGWNDVFEGTNSPARAGTRLGLNNNFYFMEDELANNYRAQVSPLSSLSRFFGTLSGKSLVLQRFNQAIANRRKRGTTRTIRNLPATNQQDLLNSIVATYVNNVRKMALFTRASGAEFLVVFQLEVGQRANLTAEEREIMNTWTIGDSTYNDLLPALYRDFLTQVKPLLTREGVTWVDANESPLYQADPQTLFFDPVHTNRHGNEIAAQFIIEKLQPLLARK
jgi:lysophospholipase L1-like esterase